LSEPNVIEDEEIEIYTPKIKKMMNEIDEKLVIL